MSKGSFLLVVGSIKGAAAEARLECTVQHRRPLCFCLFFRFNYESRHTHRKILLVSNQLYHDTSINCNITIVGFLPSAPSVVLCFPRGFQRMHYVHCRLEDRFSGQFVGVRDGWAWEVGYRWTHTYIHVETTPTSSRKSSRASTPNVGSRSLRTRTSLYHIPLQ